jgi:hypothetical protein
MVKSNELRLGNWVTYNPESVDKGTEIIPLKISAIDAEQGFLLDDGFDNVYEEDEIQPIELTPEILEAAGFEEVRPLVFRKGRLQVYGKLAYLLTEDMSEAVYMPVVLDYLHQLQNLYFSLVGQELEIVFNNKVTTS